MSENTASLNIKKLQTSSLKLPQAILSNDPANSQQPTANSQQPIIHIF